MSRRVVIALMIMSFTAGAIVGVLGYIWTVGGSGEPSGPISAPTLSVNTPVPTDSATSAPANPTAEAASQGSTLFRIRQDGSEVRFILDEILQGAPNTVIGTTDQVAGDILVNFADPPASQVGTIRINARTLVTDSELRNRAIRSQILQSSQSQYEFIDFVPTGVAGLPDSAAVGATLSFQIQGDLTIRNIANPVTFDATVNVVSDTRLEGTASTLVTRDMYNLQIPSVPGVANVSNDVRLEISFVAVQVSE